MRLYSSRFHNERASGQVDVAGTQPRSAGSELHKLEEVTPMKKVGLAVGIMLATAILGMGVRQLRR